jgi:hypothetical protein
VALDTIIAVKDAASKSRVSAIVDVHSSTFQCSVAMECAVESRQGTVNPDCTALVMVSNISNSTNATEIVCKTPTYWFKFY